MDPRQEGGQGIDPPKARPKRSRPRKYAPEIFARIVALKEETPRRTAAGILVILRSELPGKVPSVSTVRKFLAASGLGPGDPARFLPGRDTKSRKVAHNGTIQYKGMYLTVGYKLAGQIVEVREASAGTELLMYLDGVLLKKFDL